jgi:hypothetical protein
LLEINVVHVIGANVILSDTVAARALAELPPVTIPDGVVIPGARPGVIADPLMTPDERVINQLERVGEIAVDRVGGPNGNCNHQIAIEEIYIIYIEIGIGYVGVKASRLVDVLALRVNAGRQAQYDENSNRKLIPSHVVLSCIQGPRLLY